MKGENEPHGGKSLPAGLAPIIIIGVALVVLAVLSLATESDIITNLVFAFGVIFIVLTVHRLISNQAQERRRQMTTQKGARTNKQGAPHKTRRPKDQRRKPPGGR
jgi:threonine/homoserine/homoserine lactone efflux protein